MHSIIFRKSALKDLQRTPIRVREKIVMGIHALASGSETLNLDVKRLVGTTGYRLRIGQWRIIFERDDILKIISIEKIGTRGGIYK